MQRSNNARAIGGADLLLQRSRAWGQRVLFAQRRGVVTSAAHFSLCVSFVHFPGVFSFSQPRCFLVLIVFFRAAVGLRQFSESRLVFSFFRERKRPHSRPLAGMSKAIPGRRSSSPEAAPPPARSSRIPASVIRCLCMAPEMRCAI